MSDHSNGNNPHFFDDPENKKRVRYVLYVLCALSVLADLIVHRHVDHPWESLFSFYCIYGFAAIIGLVLISKQLRKVVMRGEDYYDR